MPSYSDSERILGLGLKTSFKWLAKNSAFSPLLGGNGFVSRFMLFVVFHNEWFVSLVGVWLPLLASG